MFRRYSLVAMMLCLLLLPCTLIAIIQMNNSAVSTLVFSHDSGFYDDDFMLMIKCPRGCTVYYTLDCTEPNEQSYRFEHGIKIDDASKNDNVYSLNTDSSIGYKREVAERFFCSLETPWYVVPSQCVDKCTVIRACYYDSKGVKSDVITKVYFVGFGQKIGYQNCSIISISCDPADLFDYDNGIYVCGKDMDEYLANGNVAPNWSWWPGNFSRRHSAGERIATATMFDTYGNLLFEKEIGIRVQGNSSRGLMPKSLNLFSREEYDGEDFFPILSDVGYAAHSINLFMGSQDYCTKVRDALVNDLSSGLDIGVRTYSPVALFLNGEYWGLYFLTEKYDEEFFQHFYGVSRNNVSVIRNDYLEEGERKYLDQYREIIDFLSNNDMSDDENYLHFCELVDVKSYADYYSVMIFIGRYNDWPKGNIGTWRTEEVYGYNEYQDGKWRYFLFDVNSGCLDIRYLEFDSIEYVLENDTGFANLCKNQKFVSLLKDSLTEVMERSFSDERIVERVEYYRELLREPMIINNQRFFSSNEYTDPYEYANDGDTFDEKMTSIEEYLLNRKKVVYSLMEDHFGYY